MIEDRDRDSDSLDKEAQTTFHQVKPGMTAEDAAWLDSIPQKEQDRIYHKVDVRLVPMLALCKCLRYENGRSSNLTDLQYVRIIQSGKMFPQV